MIKSYKDLMNRSYYIGKLGKFKYDNTEFKLIYGTLRYIGTETDGSKIKIPTGVKDCSYMFSRCRSLVRAPAIPAGVKDCSYMFYDCVSLTEAPEIPAGVTDCDWMFAGCTSLRNYSLDNATFSDDMYCSCPSVIQEIDDFIQKFIERKQLNDKTV